MDKKLYLLDNLDQKDPAVNLAIEEFSVRNLNIEHDYLFVYQNRPSVIIGRHQNIFEEINQKYVRITDTPVYRRISGGGAVYHDSGNINFTFITRHTFEKFNNYRMFVMPVIRTLNEFSVPAVLNARNDIMIENKKVSGNAQFTSRDRMLSHGTLLIDSDLVRLRRALKINNGRIESKSTKSVRGAVTNVREYFRQKIDINTFKEELTRNISSAWRDLSVYKFDDDDWNSIRHLVRKKFSTWDWTYGQSPKCIIYKSDRIAGIQLEAELEIHNGTIRRCSFQTSGNATRKMKELEYLLTNKRYFYDDIRRLLREIDLNLYFKNVTDREFLEFLY